ncbi:MAG TPA: zinc dependent phospholipase C family protein [Cyclobacteriaceae bacterium]|nr:zinc dependent phospholipase C family protein [Cyclobacteriaceae bacterium]
MNFIRANLLTLIFLTMSSWGFFGHENINRLAVYTLPAEMISFYKKNIHYIVEASVYPDMRRYAIPEEGPRHYIDMDEHNDSIPQRWNDAVEKIGKDSLMLHGIVPWHTYRVYLQLRNAFMTRDAQRVLRLSAELGHYVADAHVPLHTTSNHNGQKTDQHGIHGLWESRLPELFSANYDFFVGRAEYINDVQKTMWDVVMQSHACVDSVLNFERELSKREIQRKYAFETRGKQTVKVYSERYSKLYHSMLQGMVERRMRSSIHMVGNLWYSAWVDAGQPDLKNFQYQQREEEADSVKTWTASEH